MLIRTPLQKAARSTRRAFTLLEVLVVVAIIVILAGAGSYYVYQRYEEAKISRAKMDAAKLAGYLEQYRLANDGQYPATIEGLATTQPNGGEPFATPAEVRDPWGKLYQLDVSGSRARVLTTTPKGVTIDSAAVK